MAFQPTLKIKDLAEILGVSNHLIYKIIKENNIDVVAKGNKNLLPPESIRIILEKRGFVYKKHTKPKVISILGMKGGTGKTSIATALSQGAHRLGFKVLMVDIDMQGNLTQAFGKKTPGASVLFDVFNNDVSTKDTIKSVFPGLDIIPSSLNNAGTEVLLSSMQFDDVYLFHEILEPVYSDYDLIVIDCPPAVNKITSCATMFSDMNIIPVNSDTDSFDGVAMSVSEIKRLENAFKNHRLKIYYKIVFNKYDAREKLNLTVMSQIAQNPDLANNLLQVVIRTDTSFKNTKAEQGSIFDLNKSAAREDCLSLITELTEINMWLQQRDSPTNDNIFSTRQVETV